MKKRIPGTAENVAKQAGVSVFTVSRVFAGTGRISDATRRRVLDVAQKVGYTPNPASRALRSGRLNIMAFVLTGHESLLGEFYTTMLAGMQKVMSGRNMDVLLSILPLNMRLEEWLHHLTASRRCGALAVVIEKVDAEMLDMLRAIKQPVVALNVIPSREAVLSGMDSVGFDNAAGIRQAVLHLSGLGHRNIAFFGGSGGWQDSMQRERGFRKGMELAGLKIKDEWVVECDFGKPFFSGAGAMDVILGRSVNRPTALICASDEIAMGAISGARKWGISIPGELSITGFDDVAWSSFHQPPLTTVEHSGWTIGFRAANLLLNRYERPDTPHENIVLPTQLIVRQSTSGPPPDSKQAAAGSRRTR